MPLQSHISLPSPPPPCCHPAQAGPNSASTRDGGALLPSSQSCPWGSEESEAKTSVYSCLPRGENSHNQYHSGTNGNVIFFWIQPGEIKNTTAAKIQIQGFCYDGWYHPKYLKQHQLCSLFSVRCLWRCLQCTKCLWSAAEEEMQSPDTQSCPLRKRPVQSAMCWVPSVSSATSRNQGHSSGPHRLRLLRRNFGLCCFWNI